MIRRDSVLLGGLANDRTQPSQQSCYCAAASRGSIGDVSRRSPASSSEQSQDAGANRLGQLGQCMHYGGEARVGCDNPLAPTGSKLGSS
jgi:hypothetical protein